MSDTTSVNGTSSGAGRPLLQRITESITPRWHELRVTIHLLNRNLVTRVALITCCVILVLALVAPYIVPDKDSIRGATNPGSGLLGPSISHFFGTDELGRDIFSRVIYGTTISVRTALLAVGLALLIGAPLGAIAGSSRRWVDETIMRVTDVFLSFPSILLAIAIAAFLGPSLRNATFACVVSWWPWYARLVRGQAISIRERQFVRAARAMGTSQRRIVFRHVMPNTIAPVIIQATMDIGGVILTLAALSFLGLGAQPPTAEWGLMINTSRMYFLEAWWYAIFPGMAILITTLAFNLVGDGLREVLDPRTRRLS